MEKRLIISKKDTEDHTWDLHCRSGSCSWQGYCLYILGRSQYAGTEDFHMGSGCFQTGCKAGRRKDRCGICRSSGILSGKRSGSLQYYFERAGLQSQWRSLLSKLTEIQKQREERQEAFPKEENIEPECQIEEDEEQEKQALDLSNFGTEERKVSVDAAIQYDKEKKNSPLWSRYRGQRSIRISWRLLWTQIWTQHLIRLFLEISLQYRSTSMCM